MFFTIFNPFLRNFHPLFARFFTPIYPLFFTGFRKKNSLFYNSFYLVFSLGILSFTIPLFHPISTTFRTLFAQNSAFLYTHFSLPSPYTFPPLNKQHLHFLVLSKEFLSNTLVTPYYLLTPSTSYPSHPILPFSFLSFHPSFIFYSLVFLLSLL